MNKFSFQADGKFNSNSQNFYAIYKGIISKHKFFDYLHLVSVLICTSKLTFWLQ